MDLIQWISHPNNQKEYREWLENPVTKAMLEGLAGGAMPRLDQVMTGDEALKQFGFIAGKEFVLDLMRNLLEFAELNLSEEERERQKLALLQADGYTAKDARRMLKKAG